MLLITTCHALGRCQGQEDRSFTRSTTKPSSKATGISYYGTKFFYKKLVKLSDPHAPSLVQKEKNRSPQLTSLDSLSGDSN